MYDSVKWALMSWFRRKRMESFLRIMQPRHAARILDVGGLPNLNGVPGFWHQGGAEFSVTLLNLPGAFDAFSKEELAPFGIVEANVWDCPTMPYEYDIVFSNSVIEHIGSQRRQVAFANFVHSAGRSYWIQTPSPLFPFEAHCNIPFWWLHSNKSRANRIRKWKGSGKNFLAKQMSTTRPISKDRLQSLFPNCSVLTEHFLGVPKSYVAIRRDSQVGDI